ncbi:hypothetical protein BC940DRAFT_295681 [Gongronella butleri]|nr:hypothetical protein BC940DRAFT_295681 [Gongronella butleri]
MARNIAFLPFISIFFLMPTAATPTLTKIRIYPIKSCHAVELEECEINNLGLALDRRFLIVQENGRFITQRKYASMALLRPLVDVAANTLTLTSHDDDQEPLALPLYPDTSAMPQLKVSVWKDTMTAFDMGDAAGEWIQTFLRNHQTHDATHTAEDGGDAIPKLRLVTLEDPELGHYSRQVHPRLPGIHAPFSDKTPATLGCCASIDQLNKDLVENGISNGNTINIERFRNNLDIAGTLPYEEDHWLVVRIGEVTFYVTEPVDRCPMPGIDQDTGVKDTWGGPTPYLKKTRRFAEKPKEGFFCMHAIPLSKGTVRIGDPVHILERIPRDQQAHPLSSEAA